MSNSNRQFFQILVAFCKDTTGAIAAMMALSFLALVGLLALSIDLGRAWDLDTELQNAADAAALAGATQLDGELGAISRATDAARGALSLATNIQTFATDGVGNDVGIAQVTFYSSLGDPDATPPEPPVVTNDDVDATYIEVMTDTRTVGYYLAAAVGAVSSASPVGQATAFSGSAFCQTPPLFTCAPDDGDTPPTALPLTAADVGKGVWMKGKETGGGGGGGDLFPGNFGLLCLNQEDGTTVCQNQPVMDAISRVNPLEACFAADSTVETKTGEVTGPVQTALNMRLGVYPNGNYQEPDGEPDVESNFQYGRAVVAIKGITNDGGGCNLNHWDAPATANMFPGPLDPLHDYTTEPIAKSYAQILTDITTMTYPRDSCAYDFAPEGDSSCKPSASDGGRFGDGVWDYQTYLIKNHGMTLPIDLTTFDSNRHSTSLGEEPTRYEVYLYENSLGVDEPSPSPETPYPSCGVEVAAPDRRLIPVIVADCTEATGGKTDITPLQLITLFLTEAVGFGPELDNKNIYGEVVDVGELGTLATIKRHIVMLVR